MGDHPHGICRSCDEGGAITLSYLDDLRLGQRAFCPLPLARTRPLTNLAAAHGAHVLPSDGLHTGLPTVGQLAVSEVANSSWGKRSVLSDARRTDRML